MLTTFVGNVLLVVIVKSYTLINNHFIIKYVESNKYGHPAHLPFSSVIFHNVIVFQCFFLYFNTPLACYTEVNATLNNLFYMNISIWWSIDWNWQCFSKRSVSIRHVSIMRLIKEFVFFSKFTKSLNNVTQWWKAMLIGC